MRDLFILLGMLLACIATIKGITITKLLFVRVGFILAAVSVCIGLAYFGWMPLFGGSHSPGTYYGSLMLFGGLMAFVCLAALEQMARQKESS